MSGFKLYMGNTFGQIPAIDGGHAGGVRGRRPTGKRISLHRDQLHHGAPAGAAGGIRPARPAGASGSRRRWWRSKRVAGGVSPSGPAPSILHISSADELRPLREAKARGVDITGETCPQYLLLSSEDYARLRGVIRLNPPVREAVNQAPLWAALGDGAIDMIATDHAPHEIEEKTREDIWRVD